MKKSKVRFFRTFLEALVFSALLFSSVSLSAFDTFWHSNIAGEVGRTYGFSEDAIKVLKFSSFCLDYFGPFITEVVGTVEKNVSYLELRNLPTTGQEHSASNFLHFDNLAGTLDRNWKFDYLWSRLLENTRVAIRYYYGNTKLKDDECKRLILLVLGSSIHTVEDFYSHSDWIHFNFKEMGFAQQKTDSGYDRAPTWFEVRKKLGAPSSRKRLENWKFKVGSGVFPPSDQAPLSSMSVPLSHTTMNHDNSQLYYAGESQIKYHRFGAYPAHDSASATLHQFYAINTAIGAAEEWIALLEEDSTVHKAIEYAKNWDAHKADSDVRDDLDDAISSSLMLSCILGKWDGASPPMERDKDCGTFKLLAHIHIPKMSNVFWGAFPKDSILEKISYGFGDSTGHYAFDSVWYEKHRHSKD